MDEMLAACAPSCDIVSQVFSFCRIRSFFIITWLLKYEYEENQFIFYYDLNMEKTSVGYFCPQLLVHFWESVEYLGHVV